MILHYYLSLGSNLGNREQNLRDAVAFLQQLGRVHRVSSIYVTEPVGLKDPGDDFYNLALEMHSELSPMDLLERVKVFETSMGRDIHNSHNHSRTIDIDILLCDNRVINTERLVIPHPAMANRAFVLVPLDEIAPGLNHPLLNQTITQLLARISTIPPEKKHNSRGVRPVKPWT